MSRYFLVLLFTVLGHTASAEVRWFSLATEDAQKATTFYASLFGWTIEPSSTGGYVCFLHGVPVAGISEIEQTDPDMDESQWVPAILVADVEQAQAAAVRDGAEVAVEMERKPGWGTFALLMDPEDAPFIIARVERNIGGLTTAGSWVWADLWAKDVESAVGFYGRVLDYQTRMIDDVLVFTSAGSPEASIVEIQQEGIDQGWAPYIGVNSLADTMHVAVELGGTVLMEPDEQFINGDAALIMDPTGAAFFVYELGEDYR